MGARQPARAAYRLGAGARQAARRASAGGGYVNFIEAEDRGRIRAAYGGNYGRVAQIKAAYDPENFFRINNNISPGGSGG